MQGGLRTEAIVEREPGLNATLKIKERVVFKMKTQNQKKLSELL